MDPFFVMGNPLIIQGGMGVAVSDWRLARAVSILGELGVVSGTALAIVLSRRLQAGDPGGEMRRRAGLAKVFTDPVASPTGFPFKVVALPGTLSESDVYLSRPTRRTASAFATA